MKKVIFILFFVVLFNFPSLVFGQAMNENWVCLNASRCDKSEACKALGIKGKLYHIGYLSLPTTVKLPSASDIYVVECVATGDSQICTTGNSTTDMTVYKKDNVAALKKATGYNFEYMRKTDAKTDLTNPLKSSSDGTIDPILWKDSTDGSLNRQWMALYYTAPTPTAGPTGEAGTGEEGALQQGTFAFDISSALGAGSDESCVTVSWDPYGRVFDSQTLEPIMGATVNLSLKRSDGSFSLVSPIDVVGGNITNPQTVLEDGMFSFVVPDGTYKLGVARPGYIFPVADIAKLQANYTKIYSDIYPAGSGEEIVQAGAVQHRDIPVETTGTSVSTAPKMMEYFYEASALTKTVTIKGRVSHPFTILNFYSVTPSSTDPKITVRYRQVKQVQADKMGNFTAQIDQSNFAANESFGEVELIKADLKTLTKKKWYGKIIAFFADFVKKVEAQSLQSTTMKFSPIPTYLEGYAYDGTGQIIPSATVGIYISYSNKPYYQTQADEKGYFKITSENMPKVGYKIRFTSQTGNVTNTTTTDFISQNQKYLTENKVNLNVYKNEKGKVLTNKDIVTKKPTGFFQGSGVGATADNTTKSAANNNMLIVVGILIFLILATTIILGVYLMKKRSSQPPVTPTL